MDDINILIDDLLKRLIKQKVTDLHFDISEARQCMILRRHKMNLRKEVLSSYEVYEMLKYMAGLDLLQTNLPQTGHFTYIIAKKTYYFRLAVMETPLRKSAVLRVLNLNPIADLQDCVQDEKVYQKLLRLGRFRNGIILFCGATGSGKSTTMHHFLKHYEDKQIYTLESPIEIYDEQLVQIETSKSLDFNQALAQLLRHDPDLIALGEIRFEHELKALLRAGLSGHAVCSTLHAGKIEDVISRLCDLNAHPYDLMHGLKAVVFQELTLDKEGRTHVKYKIQSGKILQRKISEAAKRTVVDLSGSEDTL